MISTYISTGFLIMLIAAVIYVTVVSPIVYLYMGLDKRDAKAYEGGFFVVLDHKPYATTRIWGQIVCWIYISLLVIGVFVGIGALLGYIVLHV